MEKTVDMNSSEDLVKEVDEKSVETVSKEEIENAVTREQDSSIQEKSLFSGEKIKVKKFNDSTCIDKKESVDQELNRYEQAKKENAVIKVNFTAIDKKATLYTFLSNGIKICMPAKHIDGFAHDPQKKELLAKYLARSYSAKVIKIDRENRVVTVSINAALSEPRKNLVSAIEKGIEDKVYIQVPARVMYLAGRDSTTHEKDYSIAMLNLGGLGITGFVHKRDWSPCFTRTLKNVAKPEDVIDVVVTGKANWESGTVYECNRGVTVDADPWKDIEEKLPKNTTVRVTCIYREDRKFFSTIQGLPEINAYCYYPDDSLGIHVEPGKDYIGFVAKVSEERKMIQIRITSAVDVDTDE